MDVLRLSATVRFQIKTKMNITWLTSDLTKKVTDRRLLYPHRARYNVPTGFRFLDALKKAVPVCCNLIHINLLGRHGTRYPLEIVTKMQKFLNRNDFVPHLKSTLENFRRTWPRKSALTRQGKQEWVNFATRMKQRFPVFLNISRLTHSGALLVEYDGAIAHHEETAFWYMHQLLKLEGAFYNHATLKKMSPKTPTSRHPTKLLQKYINIRRANKIWQYSGCQKFDRVRKSQSRNRQNLVFSDPYIRNQTTNLTARYCYKRRCAISEDDVLKLHDICGSQLLYSGNDSLCSDWPIKLLEKLAYATDVMKYYDSSYGTGLAELSACGMTGIVMEDMQKAINGWKPSHVARMICLESILPILTLGRVFPREGRLNWTAIPDENWDRSFHLSELVPMAANLLFLLYDCSQCKKNPFKMIKIHDFMVLTFLNERLVKTPYNAAEYLISFEDFKLNFRPCDKLAFNLACENLK